MRSKHRWVVPVAVLGVVVFCTIAFTLYHGADRRVAGARATGTVAPAASSTPMPSSTPAPAATGTPMPPSTRIPAATNTAAPSFTAVLVASSTPLPTIAATMQATAAPSPQPSVSTDATTTAAMILASMQLGYAPPADDPTVRAFARDLVALQPICKIEMVPLAYEIANAGAALRKNGAPDSLLDTASRLRTFAGHITKHGRIVIGSCPGLFDAYARSRTDKHGNNGNDNGDQG